MRSIAATLIAAIALSATALTASLTAPAEAFGAPLAEASVPVPTPNPMR